MKKILIVLLVLLTDIQAQFRVVPFNKDKWASQNGAIIKYDKCEHFIGSFILNGVIENYVSEKHGWKYSIALGFAWEIKDALVPWEKYGKWGGEGFSSKDLIADVGGVILNHYANKLIHKTLWRVRWIF